MATNPKKLITHNGSFHADDIFAAATLSLFLEKRGEEYEIIRTRDEEIINSGDYVFDVGGVYDPEKNRFDHHQAGGAGKRENGIEYASIGLVWKKFGEDLCGNAVSAEIVDKKLICPIDAGDNGISTFDKKFDFSPYLIQHIFSAMQPNWKEETNNIDEVFLSCVDLAREILKREIIQARDYVLAEESVANIYNKSKDKRILVLDKNYPEETLQKFSEVLFVIYPRIDECFGVRAVKDGSGTYKNRKNFPASWAGLRDEELQNITGVSDAIFCHRALFLTVVKSKEGGIKLAETAISL
jgi:uncharacterized UPF0160 family protein